MIQTILLMNEVLNHQREDRTRGKPKTSLRATHRLPKSRLSTGGSGVNPHIGSGALAARSMRKAFAFVQSLLQYQQRRALAYLLIHPWTKMHSHWPSTQVGAKDVQAEPCLSWQNLSQSEFLWQPSTTATNKRVLERRGDICD